MRFTSDLIGRGLPTTKMKFFKLLILILTTSVLFAAQDVKTVNGLAIASVKTVKNLAIASVKTVNGLDNTASGGGGITFDSFSTNTVILPAAGVLTVTNLHTVAGANTALVVTFAHMANGSATVTGVTYNGDAMTQIWSLADGTGVEAKSLGFILINPDAGTHDIVATVSANASAFYCHMVGTSWNGVNQTGTVGNSWRTPITQNDGGSAAISITASTAQNGDVVVMGIANWGTNPSTPSHTLRGVLYLNGGGR